MSSSRGLAQRGHMHPRTSTKPIQLSDYLDQEERSMLIDHERITPEYKAWYERTRAKYRDK